MGKFDTRDKKPKVWNIAIASAIMLILMVVLLSNPETAKAHLVGMIFIAYLIFDIVCLIIAFFRQLEYNPYSYNVIYYAGFTLFLLSVLATHTNALIVIFNVPALSSGPELASLIVNSAKHYMMVSAPIILYFAIVLFISNISLIRHEGNRFVNYLGILLAILMVAGELIIFVFRDSENLLLNLFAALYLYFECMLLGVIIADLIAAFYEPEKDKDFLIILGCGLLKDGTPTPLLKSRIDRALGFYKAQIEKCGKALTFITSGGQGPDEVCSESESMARYLKEQGIPEDKIIKEDKSRDTLENMKNSKEIIDAIDPNAKVAFSTSNYHVFRSGLNARRVKLRAVGMGANTKWYFWPNAAVREFVGLLIQHVGKQALIIVIMILIYIYLTIWGKNVH